MSYRINRFSCFSCCLHLLFFSNHSLVFWFFLFPFFHHPNPLGITLPACECCGDFLFLLVLLFTVMFAWRKVKMVIFFLRVHFKQKELLGRQPAFCRLIQKNCHVLSCPACVLSVVGRSNLGFFPLGVFARTCFWFLCSKAAAPVFARARRHVGGRRLSFLFSCAGSRKPGQLCCLHPVM